MGKNEADFTVIIGDLIGSRLVKNRQMAYMKITKAIDQMSQKYNDELYGGLMMTHGMDEFSAVLNTPEFSYEICRQLNLILFPLQFRFIIIRGELDVALESKSAISMDGPAFHYAMELMTVVKKQELCYYFDLSSHFHLLSRCITELANLIGTISSGWSISQNKVVLLYKKYGLQKKVSKHLKISQQAVSRKLKSASWKEINRAEVLIGDLLKSLSDVPRER